MNKIYKILLSSIFAIIMIAPLGLFANNEDTENNKDVVFRSIWKYEMDHTKYSPEDGIAKKIFFLSLNSDGTYHQYVQVVPLTPQDYFRVKNYAIDGNWSEKNGKLILNEYGKENSIDFDFMFSNFKNIDNQYISVKK
ncbi:MAG TPA: hypothetical protein PLJ42_02060 [Chitinophagales bacterium]|jgi:hypothetical protein|nr:hypothetical protein [Chitinophagales bacterium]MBP6153817.1 hypothetical protein [Chitinophagales bacterium]HQV77716.1 hypothetical protein [Chitinophagales bacterium]HQW78189.1 hypothetical protein [Chitinophagales bacterium]HRB19566.1 hypothetical protein [Chitinophagales bacterium]